MRAGILALLVAFDTCSCSTIQAWEPFLTDLYNQADSDNNGHISLSEWDAMIVRLGAQAIFTSKTTTQVFNEITSCSPGQQCEASQTQIINWATSGSAGALGTDFTQSLVGVEIPDNLLSLDAPAVIRDAKKKVSMSWTVAGDLMEYRKGDRDQILSRLATALAVDAATIIMVFSAGSVIVSIEVFSLTDGAADTVKNTMDGMSAASASTLMGCTSTCVTVVSKVTSKKVGTEMPSFTLIGAGIAILVVLLIFIIILAVCVGRMYRKQIGQAYAGCCSTGCCSFNSMRAWAVGNILAFCFLLGGTIGLYTKTSPFTSALRDIIKAIEALMKSTGPGHEAVESLPTGIVDTSKRVLDYMDLIVLLPGILAAVLLLLAALLGCRRSATQCPTKCCIFLGNIVIIVAGVLSIIFAAAGIIVGLDVAQDQLKKITSLCDTKVPVLTQLNIDAKNALDVANGIQDVDQTSLAKAQQEFSSSQNDIQSFKLACESLDQTFVNIADLFVPAFICVCGVLLGLFTNQGLCCAGNCCKKPTNIMKVNVMVAA